MQEALSKLNEELDAYLGQKNSKKKSKSATKTDSYIKIKK